MRFIRPKTNRIAIEELNSRRTRAETTHYRMLLPTSQNTNENIIDSAHADVRCMNAKNIFRKSEIYEKRKEMKTTELRYFHRFHPFIRTDLRCKFFIWSGIDQWASCRVREWYLSSWDGWTRKTAMSIVVIFIVVVSVLFTVSSWSYHFGFTASSSISFGRERIPSKWQLLSLIFFRLFFKCFLCVCVRDSQFLSLRPSCCCCCVFCVPFFRRLRLLDI